jgi:hypothetical protein
VQVLTCTYTPTSGFVAVKHDPLCSERDLGLPREIDGIAIEPTPLHMVVEELAHAILAEGRRQRPLPAALASFAHLFVPHFDADGAELPAP